jgi:hypothetical protein
LVISADDIVIVIPAAWIPSHCRPEADEQLLTASSGFVTRHVRSPETALSVGLGIKISAIHTRMADKVVRGSGGVQALARTQRGSFRQVDR